MAVVSPGKNPVIRSRFTTEPSMVIVSSGPMRETVVPAFIDDGIGRGNSSMSKTPFRIKLNSSTSIQAEYGKTSEPMFAALIDQLTTLHGYASTGESLTIADPDEIW